MRLALIAAALLTWSCGGGPTCIARFFSRGHPGTTSGALSGPYDCKPVATYWRSSINTSVFAILAPLGSPDVSLAVSIYLPGELQPGHFRLTDPGAHGDIFVKAGAQSFVWEACAVGDCFDHAGGSYDLYLAGVTHAAAASYGKTYEAHGTLDATLTSYSVFDPTLTLQVTF